MLILMGVHNGAPFLEDQLKSLTRCGLSAWELRVSDDGSRDESRDIIETFAGSLDPARHRVVVESGPGRGFAANYLSLLENLPDLPGFVALADQDDIWLPDRLSRAVGLLRRLPGRVPAFTCARRLDWWPDSGRIKPSAMTGRRPGFANALIENVAFGNTIVMNPAAARLARLAAPLAAGIYAHDWFLYQLLTGAGALCLQEREPALLYRQHSGNAIGAAGGIRGWLGRKVEVLQGVNSIRIGAQIAALRRCETMLLPENQMILSHFARGRVVPLGSRLQKFRQAGVYRQRRVDDFGFWGAAVLGKV